MNFNYENNISLENKMVLSAILLGSSITLIGFFGSYYAVAAIISML